MKLFSKIFPSALVILFSVFHSSVKLQCAACPKDATDNYYLDLEGHISFGKTSVSHSTITIYIDSTSVFRDLQSDANGRCMFPLPLQRVYLIKFSNPGFVTKIIEVDTRVPQNMEANYLFEFSIDLFEEITELDVSMLKKPVGKIIFNARTNLFDYDQNYTDAINKDIKSLYRNYYLLKVKGKKGSTPIKSSTIPKHLWAADLNKDGYISSVEMNTVVEGFMEDTNKFTMEDIRQIIELFLEE